MRAVMMAVALLLCWPSLAQAQTPSDTLIGEWTGSIQWADGGRTDNVGWTFNADGTFVTSDGYEGIWTQYGDHAVWIISAGPRAVYEVDVTGDALSGAVNNRNGVSGATTMRRRQSGRREK